MLRQQGASQRPTVITPVFASCSYCERYAVPGIGASKCVTPKSLPSTCRMEEKSGLFEIMGFCSIAAKSTVVRCCASQQPRLTRRVSHRRRKAGIIIMLLQRAWKSGHQGLTVPLLLVEEYS